MAWWPHSRRCWLFFRLRRRHGRQVIALRGAACSLLAGSDISAYLEGDVLCVVACAEQRWHRRAYGVTRSRVFSSVVPRAHLAFRALFLGGTRVRTSSLSTLNVGRSLSLVVYARTRAAARARAARFSVVLGTSFAYFATSFLCAPFLRHFLHFAVSFCCVILTFIRWRQAPPQARFHRLAHLKRWLAGEIVSPAARAAFCAYAHAQKQHYYARTFGAKLAWRSYHFKRARWRTSAQSARGIRQASVSIHSLSAPGGYFGAAFSRAPRTNYAHLAGAAGAKART